MSKAVHGPTNPIPGPDVDGVQRFGSVIELVPEKEAYYRELHSGTWPAVLERIAKSNIKNYNIFTTELAGTKYLFSFMEYHGKNLEEDMAAIGTCPETQRWWKETDPCQSKIKGTPEGEQWLPLERVFFK